MPTVPALRFLTAICRSWPQVFWLALSRSFRTRSRSYQLIRILGEGGMGVVWLARRKDADNLVAAKFLPHARLSPARLARFTDEIKTQGKLRHPYIARFYDAGTLADATPWFVMEYVEGVPITEYCAQHQLDAEATLRLFRCVCEAVQYAHGQEVIHRDLKPSNILVEKDASPRLLDFGIAKQLHNLEEAKRTKPEFRFMTKDYAAPEWKYDGVVGFRTDVYSLGVILYQLLAGMLAVFPRGCRQGRGSPRGANREGIFRCAVQRQPFCVASTLGVERPGRSMPDRNSSGSGKAIQVGGSPNPRHRSLPAAGAAGGATRERTLSRR